MTSSTNAFAAGDPVDSKAPGSEFLPLPPPQDARSGYRAARAARSPGVQLFPVVAPTHELTMKQPRNTPEAGPPGNPVPPPSLSQLRWQSFASARRAQR